MNCLSRTVLFLLWLCSARADAVVLRCSQVEKQAAPGFQLVRRCSRSAMAVVAQANVTSVRRCADLAASRRGLAFNYGPRGAPRGESQFSSSCLVLECPELAELSSLHRDEAYDYYSLYTDPMPQPRWTCVPGVGMFRVSAGAERANYSAAGEQCREHSGELAHVLSEARTEGLSTLLASPIKDSKNRTVPPVRRAFVNLDDTVQEGMFVTSADEPLDCFPFRAWSPGEPRARSEDDDCVVLERRRSWSVTNCSLRLPFICELYPAASGTGPAGVDCSLIEDPDEREECLDLRRLQGSAADRCSGWDLLDVPPPQPTTTAAPEYGEDYDGQGGGDEGLPEGNSEDGEDDEDEDTNS